MIVSYHVVTMEQKTYLDMLYNFFCDLCYID